MQFKTKIMKYFTSNNTKKQIAPTVKLCWLAAILFFGFTATATGQTPETEPNDDCSTANIIADNGVYTGSIATETDEDWFYFQGTNSDVTVTMGVSGTTTDYGYSIYQRTTNCGDNTSTIENNALFSLVDDPSYTFNASASSVYVIQIKYFDFDVVPENYTITISGLNTSQSLPFGSLWLKANDGATESGGNLTGWTDKTGTNTFTVHGSVGFVTNSINFNPVVSINNTQSNTLLPNVYLSGNTAITYVDGFAVMRKTDPNCGTLIGSSVHQTNYGVAVFSGESDAGMWVGNGVNNTYQHFTNSNVSTGNVALVNLNVSLASSPYATGRLNGLNQTMSAGSAGDFTSINFTPWIGGTSNNGSTDGWKHFKGEAAEIMLYPNSVSATDRLKIESYLAIKYGITLDQSVTNYVASDGTTVLWNNISYWNDVFGIGQDDEIGLTQSSSNSANTGSGDGTGQSGKGNIVLSNPSSLDAGDFLMVGHDNGALSAQYTDLPSTVKQARIAREWKADHTGDVGTVDLSFELNGISLSGTIGTATTDFNILIDSDGDGDFSNATATNPSSVSGTLLTFNGLTIPDGAVFSFSFQLTKTWDGSESTVWANGDNWAQGATPDASGFDHVVIADVATDPIIPNNGQITVKDLTIESGGVLTITSDASGTGSLIVNGTQSNSGTINIQRYVTGEWTTWDAGWHQISSPLSSQSIESFVAGNYDFYGWEESTDLWMNFKDGGFSAWNSGTNFNVGQGYLISYDADETSSFTGSNLNLSDVTLSNLSHSGTTYSGWHLLGNPYSSALQWNQGNWALSNVAGTAKVWNEASKGYSDILANAYIPIAQGFMVQVSGGTNSLTIPKAARVHNSQAWYKNADEINDVQHIKLIAAEADNRSWQEHNIIINEDASMDFDFDYDSRFLSGYAPQFYAIVESDKLSTNSIPNLSDDIRILMGFIKNEAVEYKIVVTENSTEKDVFIFDYKTGKDYNLSEDSYFFTSAEGDASNRFEIHFGIVGVNEEFVADSQFRIYSTRNNIVIDNIENQSGEIRIYNLQGQLITRQQLTQDSKQQVAIENSGIHLVALRTNNNVITKKVITSLK